MAAGHRSTPPVQCSVWLLAAILEPKSTSATKVKTLAHGLFRRTPSTMLFDVAWPNERSRNILRFCRVIGRDIVRYYRTEINVEYSFGSLWTAENSPRNFLILRVAWNLTGLEQYLMVPGVGALVSTCLSLPLLSASGTS